MAESAPEKKEDAANKKEVPWYTDVQLADIEIEFIRANVDLNRGETDPILNNTDPKWPKWFEGATVNMSYDCLDNKVKDGLASKKVFAYVEDENRSRVISYSQLLSKVITFTTSLSYRIGLDLDGARVLIILPTCLEAVISILACLRLGVLFSLMEPNYLGCMLLRLEDFKPTLVITTNGCVFDPLLLQKLNQAMALMTGQQPRVRFIWNRGSPYTKEPLIRSPTLRDWDFYDQDAVEQPVCFRRYSITKPLCVAYTAGTTGPPKGCVHTAFSLYMACFCDRGFTMMPLKVENPVSFFFTNLSNIVGLVGIVLKPLLFHVQSLLHEAVVEDFEPGTIYDLLRNRRVTSAYFSKTTLEQLKSMDTWEPLDKSVEYRDIILETVFTSVPSIDEILIWTQNLFLTPLQVYNFYAITELGGIIFTDHSDEKGQPLSFKMGGRLFPFINAKVMRSGRELKEDESGDFSIKLPLPPTMMLRYYNDENDERYLGNFIKGQKGTYYDVHDQALFDGEGSSRNWYFLERSLPFNEADFIPVLERYMKSTCWVKDCCVLCKTAPNKKRLYGFFQLKLKYLELKPETICKEIQGVVRSTYGSYLNFEAVELWQMPVLQDGRLNRKKMNAILQDITQGDSEQENILFNSFLAKVREINRSSPE